MVSTGTGPFKLRLTRAWIFLKDFNFSTLTYHENMTWRLCYKSRVDILAFLAGAFIKSELVCLMWDSLPCVCCAVLRLPRNEKSRVHDYLDVASKSLFIQRNCQHDRDCWHLPQPKSPWRGWSWSCIVCLAAGSRACVSIEITLGNLCVVSCWLHVNIGSRGVKFMD